MQQQQQHKMNASKAMEEIRSRKEQQKKNTSTSAIEAVTNLQTKRVQLKGNVIDPLHDVIAKASTAVINSNARTKMSKTTKTGDKAKNYESIQFVDDDDESDLCYFSSNSTMEDERSTNDNSDVSFITTTSNLTRQKKQMKDHKIAQQNKQGNSKSNANTNIQTKKKAHLLIIEEGDNNDDGSGDDDPGTPNMLKLNKPSSRQLEFSDSQSQQPIENINYSSNVQSTVRENTTSNNNNKKRHKNNDDDSDGFMSDAEDVGVKKVSRKNQSKRKQYSEEEKDAIKEGYNRFSNEWAVIKAHYPVLSSRSNVNIKDCYRTMRRRGEI